METKWIVAGVVIFLFLRRRRSSGAAPDLVPGVDETLSKAWQDQYPPPEAEL